MNSVYPVTSDTPGTSALSSTVGRCSGRAASPAAGATRYCTDLDVLLRCRVAGTWRVAGELPMAVTRGPFALNTLITSAVNATSVALGAGTTIAVGLHVGSLPGGSSLRLIAERHTDGPDTGWYLCSAGNRLKLYLAGVNSGTPVDLGVDLVAGACAVAVSIHASEVRACVNGGSVVSAAISGTYVPPGTGAQLTLGGNYAVNSTIFFGIGSMAWFATWASALGDAAKQAVGAAYATYLPGEAGADPSATWAAFRTAPGADAQAQLIAATPVPLAINAALGRTVR